ncbi:MAG: DNA recombination protein RmuC [Paracoccaceae bacterium]|jgi:DNA recombination protein RmuC|nr:DNA recombination protein RmuC [Paracoccaceae bacterium]
MITEQATSIFSLNMNSTLILSVGLFLLFLFLIYLMRRPFRQSENEDTLKTYISQLNQTVQNLNGGQSQLTGSLESLNKAHTMSVQNMEVRLAEVQRQMSEHLHDNALKSARSLSDLEAQVKETLTGSSEKTNKSLTQLQERLSTIDKAQSNIEKLSGDVLSLQDILSNKQTRGAFGEIQLNDIVKKALPPDSYSFQHTLSNGKRADCLIYLPNPPGPIVIDAKFPLEAYEKLISANTNEEKAKSLALLKQSVKTHIRAISEKYLIEGETADGALMFLPSEAVYAELHAKLPEVVREGFSAKVWIVSPTTCMATLHTMRAILKDARMQEQAGEIRKTLSLVNKDVKLIVERAGKLDTHFSAALKDLEGINIAAGRAGKRSEKLDNFDFEELEPERADTIIPLKK